MLDTMTITKVAAGLCGAWLVFLLGKWAGETLFHADAHGEASYVIETEDSGGAAEEEAVPFADLLAAADVGKGERVFRKCSSCHSLTAGDNKSGPYLFGILDRPKATADGFAYSGAIAATGGDWSADNLNAFLENPSEYASGNSMSFRGIRDAEDRANLIAYLATIQ